MSKRRWRGGEDSKSREREKNGERGQELEEHLLFVFVCLVLYAKCFGKVPLLLAKLFN